MRLLSLLHPDLASLDTVAITLELLSVSTAEHPSSTSMLLASGSGAAMQHPSSYREHLPVHHWDAGSRGSGSRNEPGESMAGHSQRRESWARIGAGAAGRCLIGLEILRVLEGCADVTGHLGGEGR